MSEISEKIKGVKYNLRSVNQEDADFIIRLRTENYQRTQYLNPINSQRVDQEKWIEEQRARPGDYYFVIEEKKSFKPVGLIGLYDVVSGQGEWGRWIIEEHSDSATESFFLICKFAFEKLNLSRIFSNTSLNNSAVIKFHDAIGAMRTGKEIRSNFRDSEEVFIEHEILKEYYFDHLAVKILTLLSRVNLKKSLREGTKMRFHHLGVATPSITSHLPHFLSLGYNPEGKIFEDPNQGIRGLFITKENAPRLELLENLPGSHTLNNWLSRNIKYYHNAYLVEDLEYTISVFLKSGAKLVSKTTRSVYFESDIAFLMMPDLNLVELIQSS